MSVRSHQNDDAQVCGTMQETGFRTRPPFVCAKMHEPGLELAEHGSCIHLQKSCTGVSSKLVQDGRVQSHSQNDHVQTSGRLKGTLCRSWKFNMSTQPGKV